jgi:hypothetical protein
MEDPSMEEMREHLAQRSGVETDEAAPNATRATTRPLGVIAADGFGLFDMLRRRPMAAASSSACWAPARVAVPGETG